MRLNNGHTSRQDNSTPPAAGFQRAVLLALGAPCRPPDCAAAGETSQTGTHHEHGPSQLLQRPRASGAVARVPAAGPGEGLCTAFVWPGPAGSAAWRTGRPPHGGGGVLSTGGVILPRQRDPATGALWSSGTEAAGTEPRRYFRSRWEGTLAQDGGLSGAGAPRRSARGGTVCYSRTGRVPDGSPATDAGRPCTRGRGTAAWQALGRNRSVWLGGPHGHLRPCHSGTGRGRAGIALCGRCRGTARLRRSLDGCCTRCQSRVACASCSLERGRQGEKALTGTLKPASSCLRILCCHCMPCH